MKEIRGIRYRFVTQTTENGTISFVLYDAGRARAAPNENGGRRRRMPADYVAFLRAGLTGITLPEDRKVCDTVNMSTSVLSVRLPDDIKARLDALVASTGRPAAFYVREAVAEHLADIEYAYTLRSEAEAIRRGEVRTRPLDEVVAELGLD